jgi:hypothetical protein
MLGRRSPSAGKEKAMNVWSDYLKAQAVLADRIAKTMTTAATVKEFADYAEATGETPRTGRRLTLKRVAAFSSVARMRTRTTMPAARVQTCMKNKPSGSDRPDKARRADAATNPPRRSIHPVAIIHS